FITTSLAKQPWFENIFLWNVAKRLLPLTTGSNNGSGRAAAATATADTLDDQIIEEAAEAVNVSPTAGLLATAEVAAKASGSGMQRMVRRAAQKPVDDRLFTWAAVGITITILILLLKKFIRSSGFVDES
ncbi:LOW QUALITY PROTEIN: hypothetical protein HID58_070831, partial [Brassica napus]